MDERSMEKGETDGLLVKINFRIIDMMIPSQLVSQYFQNECIELQRINKSPSTSKEQSNGGVFREDLPFAGTSLMRTVLLLVDS